MRDGFLKVAAKSPEMKVADCEYNSNNIINEIKMAYQLGVKLLVFPELAITSYSCDDLFNQKVLLQSAQTYLMQIVEATECLEMVVVVGLPLAHNNKLYNCAAVLCCGELLGIVPKSYLPNYTEFYEQRYFAPALKQTEEIEILGEYYPFGTKLLFKCLDMPEFVLGVEICEDLFVTLPPSEYHSLAGATIIANPSASDEIVCKPAFRRQLVSAQSAKNVGAYVYCNAHRTESTNDVVFSAHNLIAENGTILAESKPFKEGFAITEVDLQKIAAERKKTSCVRDDSEENYDVIEFSLSLAKTELTRFINPYPFLPSDKKERDERCEDILDIQCAGLIKRIEHARSKTAVIGVSGGLDSTLALLVTARAFGMMDKKPNDIVGVSMPCFGTTNRTKSNAEKLCEILNVDFRVIDITKSVTQHLIDIGHDTKTADITFENAQARERTQVIMDISNLTNGLVIGTGDLSEQALGWCTYNGDHMSMYAVNTSIPKTLVRHLVRFIAETGNNEELKAVLLDILETPVSPELLPTNGNDDIVQKTEDIVGPYELHDFFLYYTIRFGFEPAKIFRMASYAFKGIYDQATIKKWLRDFFRRFFINQFKRTCVPNGPKVGSVALSPRGDWRMPSDASSALWLKQIDDIQTK